MGEIGRRLVANLVGVLVDSVRWRDGTSMSPNLDRQRFEELVLEAVEALPERFRDRLANVDIEVRDWPSPEELQSARVPAGGMLLGLYVGIPYTRRGRYQVALPDRIFIYQRPIERLCRSDDEVRERVKRVIKHEVAHHFGLTEADLHDTSVS